MRRTASHPAHRATPRNRAGGGRRAGCRGIARPGVAARGVFTHGIDRCGRTRLLDDVSLVRFAIAAPLQLRADTGPDRQLVVRLDQVWASCAARPEACEEELRTYARRSGAAFAQGEIARPDQILPALRPASYLEGRTVSPGMGVEPFVAGMVLLYVEDSPTHLRSLREGEVAALGDVKALARANLTRHLGDAKATVLGTPPRQDRGAHDERLLRVEPNDVVLFVIAPRPETIAKLRAATEGIYAKARRPLSTSVLAWSPDGWKELPAS
jgi:hypothetical protein